GDDLLARFHRARARGDDELVPADGELSDLHQGVLGLHLAAHQLEGLAHRNGVGDPRHHPEGLGIERPLVAGDAHRGAGGTGDDVRDVTEAADVLLDSLLLLGSDVCLEEDQHARGVTLPEGPPRSQRGGRTAPVLRLATAYPATRPRSSVGADRPPKRPRGATAGAETKRSCRLPRPRRVRRGNLLPPLRLSARRSLLRAVRARRAPGRSSPPGSTVRPRAAPAASARCPSGGRRRPGPVPPPG